mmetsp:Transcript_13877/g.43468  ORF Transcript_13877/g.43468 Transcript_13877/m.43468 type:complete len:453 (+) Transcript_13877:61-1419(+)
MAPELHPALCHLLPELNRVECGSDGSRCSWRVIQFRDRPRGLQDAWADSITAEPVRSAPGSGADTAAGAVLGDTAENLQVTVIFQAFRPETTPDLLWPGGGDAPNTDALAAVDRVLGQWDLADSTGLRRLLDATIAGLPPLQPVRGNQARRTARASERLATVTRLPAQTQALEKEAVSVRRHSRPLPHPEPETLPAAQEAETNVERFTAFLGPPDDRPAAREVSRANKRWLEDALEGGSASSSQRQAREASVPLTLPRGLAPGARTTATASSGTAAVTSAAAANGYLSGVASVVSRGGASGSGNPCACKRNDGVIETLCGSRVASTACSAAVEDTAAGRQPAIPPPPAAPQGTFLKRSKKKRPAHEEDALPVERMDILEVDDVCPEDGSGRDSLPGSAAAGSGAAGATSVTGATSAAGAAGDGAPKLPSVSKGAGAGGTTAGRGRPRKAARE